MKKTCDSSKRFGKEEWQKTQRKPRTVQPIQANHHTTDTARLVSGYVWQ